jgi:redox-sensitive bicupin YhaK (pirin superfamily)
MRMKNIVKINQDTEPHWVGDGFPVNSLMSYQTDGVNISPFLLLDYAGPAVFEPTEQPRGVGQHPHRGFETVTIVYQGEVEHKDNAGNAGKIGPGDVQWMTAARGIIHEEMHGQNFSRAGGILEMIQLWVNLPAKDKMSPPHYQEISSDIIPIISLDNHGSVLRVIAGNYNGTQGAAKTFTPINVWDLRMTQGYKMNLSNFPAGFNTMLLILKGTVLVNNTVAIKEKQLVFFERENDYITLEATNDAIMLILNGEPINEPIVGQGPFVMNTKDEINQAFMDYRTGRF